MNPDHISSGRRQTRDGLFVREAATTAEISELQARLREGHDLGAGHHAGHILWQGVYRDDPETGVPVLLAVLCWGGAAALNPWLAAHSELLPKSLAMDGKDLGGGTGALVTLCHHHSGRPPGHARLQRGKGRLRDARGPPHPGGRRRSARKRRDHRRRAAFPKKPPA